MISATVDFPTPNSAAMLRKRLLFLTNSHIFNLVLEGKNRPLSLSFHTDGRQNESIVFHAVSFILSCAFKVASG